VYHWVLLTTGVGAAILYTLLNFQSWYQFLFLLTVPLLVINGLAVSRKPSTELDPYLRQMALSTLLFVILFGIGRVI
jgi:1,4-dihydroxy-2-naphthoate octaprenyltransferase